MREIRSCRRLPQLLLDPSSQESAQVERREMNSCTQLLYTGGLVNELEFCNKGNGRSVREGHCQGR